MKHYITLITFCFIFYNYQTVAAGTPLNSGNDPVGKLLESTVDDPDQYRNVSELITSKGYPLEEHTVTTTDGYVLSIQRIPHGKNSDARGDKGVICLFHGEIGDSKAWFLNPPGQGLGYILPDAGYDVWMVNNRGSTYSKKNVNFPTNTYRFWRFSFDEMAKYDGPATIDYILGVTGKETLSIIGYSRGNTVGFAMLSDLPEYNKKVNLFVALAPVAFVGHMTSVVQYFIPIRYEIAALITPVTKGEFFPDYETVRILTAKFCEVEKIEFCQNILFAIAGQDESQLNKTRVPIYSAQYPSSTSVRSLLHYAQLYLSEKFCKYDHGADGNKKAYGQEQPPDYQLSQITSPVALFWSKNDKIADEIDVGILKGELKSVVYGLDPVSDDRYNHFDFIWGISSPELIYKPILDLLARYNKN